MKKRYSLALKESTQLCVDDGGSLCKIAIEINKKYQLEGKWKITHETLRFYTDPNHPERVNSSPMKQGPKPSLPPVLLELVQVHVSMCQLSGNGERKPKKLKAIIGAAIANTLFKNNLSVGYIYKQLRHRFPNKVQQSKAMQVEDCRMNWTTYPNLNAWFNGSKQCLIHYGYVEDKPQLVHDIFQGRSLPCKIPGKKFLS